MERAYGRLEKEHINLQNANEKLQKDLEIVTKSRDQKDKHLAIMYKENLRPNTATPVVDTKPKEVIPDPIPTPAPIYKSKKLVIKGMDNLSGMNYQTEKNYKLQIMNLKKQNKELLTELSKVKKK